MSRNRAVRYKKQIKATRGAGMYKERLYGQQDNVEVEIGMNLPPFFF